jgi:hypothetical protein
MWEFSLIELLNIWPLTDISLIENPIVKSFINYIILSRVLVNIDGVWIGN